VHAVAGYQVEKSGENNDIEMAVLQYASYRGVKRYEVAIIHTNGRYAYLICLARCSLLVKLRLQGG
jgi:hypothetical protein